MKIGTYISPAHTVPPEEKQILAPWRLVSELADGLVARGHTVYLFASKQSTTKAQLKDFGIGPMYMRQSELSSWVYKEAVIASELELFTKMMETAAAEGIEVIHAHQPIERLYPAVAKAPKTLPILFTFHDPILSNRVEGLDKLVALGNCQFISISNAQRDNFVLPFAGTVYNGIPLSEFPYGEKPETDRYMVAGRVVPEKGFDDAIAAVKQVGGKLIIAGKVYQTIVGANGYWKEKIEPHLNDGFVHMEQFLALPDLVKYYASSKAFLFPVKWEEPFGLVMIEALACGAPVVAYNRGSVPEIVKDGVTGFIVDQDNEDRPGRGSWIIKEQGIAGLVSALKRIGEIDRAACRKHVEERFTMEKMIEGYEKIYQQVIAQKHT